MSQPVQLSVSGDAKIWQKCLAVAGSTLSFRELNFCTPTFGWYLLTERLESLSSSLRLYSRAFDREIVGGSNP